MDKGHEPIVRLLSSVTIETNKKKKPDAEPPQQKAYFSLSHNSCGWMARAVSQRGGQVGVRRNKRSTKSDWLYQPTLLKNYPSLRPDSHSCEDNQSLPTAVSSWCNLLLESLISYRPTASQHPPRGQGSTVWHSRRQSASEAYQGELRDSRWRFHLIREIRGM